MFCKYCGKKVEDDARFCSACGTSLEKSDFTNTDSSSSFQPYSTYSNESVTSSPQTNIKNWKSYMIVTFALWAISVFPLFSNWISLNLFGYYEDSISLFAINEFYQDMLDTSHSMSSDYPDNSYYDTYVDINGHYSEDISKIDEEFESFVNGINTYITVFCICFAVFLLASLSGFAQETPRVFVFSIALSVSLILFPLITIVFIKNSLQSDLLSSTVFSFTAAPYILIILNILALATTWIAKNTHLSISDSTDADPVVLPSITGEISSDDSSYTTKNVGESKMIVEINNCASASSITIPDTIGNQTVTQIGEELFSKCKKLKTIILPDSITHIRYGAFSGCASLSQIILPPELEEIHAMAFSDCHSLHELVIPAKTRFIDRTAFWGCTITIFAPHDASFYNFDMYGNGLFHNIIWQIQI